MPINPQSGAKYDVGMLEHTKGPTDKVATGATADTSTAEFIKSVGGEAIDAVSGFEKAKLENKLKQINYARQQGGISAYEASARARSAVKESSARLPGLANDFRKQAGTFFSEFGQGGGALDLTSQEKINAKLAQDQALWKQNIQQKAAEQGLSPEAYITGNNLIYNASLADAELKVGNINTFDAWQDAFNDVAGGAQINILNRIRSAVSEGKGLSPDQQLMLNQEVELTKARMDGYVRSAKFANPQMQQQAQAIVDNWYNSQKELIKNSNRLTYLDTLAQTNEAGLTVAAQMLASDQIIINKALGQVGVEYYFKAAENDALSRALSATDPMFRHIRNLTDKGRAQLYNDTMMHVLGLKDNSSVIPPQLIDRMSLGIVTDPEAPDDIKGRALDNITAVAGSRPAGMEVYKKPAVKSWVLKRPEETTRLKNGVDRWTASIKTAIAQDPELEKLLANTEVELSAGGDLNVVTPDFQQVRGAGVRGAHDPNYEVNNSIRKLYSLAKEYPELLMKGQSFTEWAQQFGIGGTGPAEVLPRGGMIERTGVRRVTRDADGNLVIGE